MNNDQDVREQVLDITKSFLVQAPAGSGKTSILVKRFLSALAVAESGPEEVIAITFTRKAATEMRDRILNALQSANKSVAAPEDSLWQLAHKVLLRDNSEGWQLLNNPARLKIQTIDALCTSITSQMPILSNFGAQPQIEPQPESLYARAVDQLLQMVDQDCIWQPAIFKLLAHLANDRVKAKKLLISILSIRDQWLPLLMQQHSGYKLRTYLEQGLFFACDEALQSLMEVIPSCLDFTLLPCAEPQTLEDWLMVADVLLTADGAWRRQVTAKQGFAAPSATADKEEKQQLKERKAAMHAMLEVLCKHEEFRMQLLTLRQLPSIEYTEQQWQIVAVLTELLPVLAAQLTVVFRDSGKVDFTAVALAAIAALADQNSTDLALALDCKIRHILVDEFQDTSHTQFILLQKLTASWDGRDGRTLFLVGDPMQSIYRFRQAEVGLFLKAKQNGIGNIKLNFAQLRVNFRSSANIINWVNTVFTLSFPAADNKAMGAISYMPAQAAVVAEPESIAVHGYAIKDALEPAKIIEIIQELKLTNPEYSIAILVRAKSHLLKLLPALREAQIEYQGREIENLYELQLVQDLLSLTKALLHLDDKIAWLAILRAPWCGLSLADLQIIARYDVTIWSALQHGSIKEQLSAAALPRVSRLSFVIADSLLQLGRKPIVEIVKSTWLALGGAECLGASDEYQYAETFFTFLENIANKPELYNPDFLDQELQKLFASPNTINSCAVQIMTIHKAKGLEFDAVILPSLHRSIKNDEQRLLLLEQRDYEHNYLLLAPIRSADTKEDVIYNYLSWCEKQRQEYETLRQLYVAVTRAKHKIYYLADVVERVPDPRSMISKIWPYVMEQVSINEQPQQEIIVSKQTAVKRLPMQWYVENEYSLQAHAGMRAQYTPWQANWLNQAGTVMHRILWHIATVGRENLSTEYFSNLSKICLNNLRALRMAPVHYPESIELITTAITRMLADEFGGLVLSAAHKESYAEWGITQPKEHKFATVYLDRAFLHDNVFYVIDYKLVHNQENLFNSIQQNTEQILHYVELVKLLKPGYTIKGGLYFPLQATWQQIC